MGKNIECAVCGNVEINEGQCPNCDWDNSPVIGCSGEDDLRLLNIELELARSKWKNSQLKQKILTTHQGMLSEEPITLESVPIESSVQPKFIDNILSNMGNAYSKENIAYLVSILISIILMYGAMEYGDSFHGSMFLALFGSFLFGGITGIAWAAAINNKWIFIALICGYSGFMYLNLMIYEHDIISSLAGSHLEVALLSLFILMGLLQEADFESSD